MSPLEKHDYTVDQPETSRLANIELTAGRLTIGALAGIPLGAVASLITEEIGIKPSVATFIAPMVFAAISYNNHRRSS